MPPAPPWIPERGSNLARASSSYAQLRRIAMSQGGEPGMALRAEISSQLTSSEVLEEVVFFGINANTLSTDVRAWDMWETVCRSHDTSPLRTAAEARDFPERNAHLLATLMLHAFAVCRPRQLGRRFIKPKSALAYPLAIVRIFSRWSVAMPSYKLLKAAVAGLSRAYLAYHGPYSLAPHRAEPMKFSMVRDMVRIPAQPNSPAKIGGLTWSDDDQNVFIFRRLICVMMFTAFRLGEIVRHTSGEIMFLTFESLTWVIGGVVVSHPTAAQLAARGTALDQAVDQLLAQSERDNESIYMVAVPPGLQPPPVEAKTLVGACVKCRWLCPCHEHTAVLLPPSPLAADTALPDITRVCAGWFPQAPCRWMIRLQFSPSHCPRPTPRWRHR